MGWSYAYLAIHLLGTLTALSHALRSEDHSLPLIELLFVALPNLLVLVGLWRRTHWGYRLNQLMLGLVPVGAAALPGLAAWSDRVFVASFFLVVWVAPNLVYFHRRRHLFS